MCDEQNRGGDDVEHQDEDSEPSIAPLCLEKSILLPGDVFKAQPRHGTTKLNKTNDDDVSANQLKSTELNTTKPMMADIIIV